ncbi:MAG: hypothetical protein HY820_07525 [Acidobacteria bacterium]|nr:hypothetical protein [Acidobacteriota bacterium]
MDKTSKVKAATPRREPLNGSSKSQESADKAFQVAKKKVFAVHDNLLRRLAK